MTSPLGDQRGWVLNPPCVSRRTLVPSASITKTCAGPARSETKAISRPVGDQLGSVSMAALLVSRRSAKLEDPLYGYAVIEVLVGLVGLVFHDLIYQPVTGWAYDSLFPAP